MWGVVQLPFRKPSEKEKKMSGQSLISTLFSSYTRQLAAANTSTNSFSRKGGQR
jgi:hypothetical protein